MNIDEVRKAKQDLSRDISDRINQFEKETGVYITSIDIPIMELLDHGGNPVYTHGLIDIRLNL